MVDLNEILGRMPEERRKQCELDYQRTQEEIAKEALARVRERLDTQETLRRCALEINERGNLEALRGWHLHSLSVPLCNPSLSWPLPRAYGADAMQQIGALQRHILLEDERQRWRDRLSDISAYANPFEAQLLSACGNPALSAFTSRILGGEAQRQLMEVLDREAQMTRSLTYFQQWQNCFSPATAEYREPLALAASRERAEQLRDLADDVKEIRQRIADAGPPPRSEKRAHSGVGKWDVHALALAKQWDKEGRAWGPSDIAKELGIDRSQLLGKNKKHGADRSPMFKAYWDATLYQRAERKRERLEGQGSEDLGSS